jgi:20S proteasome alpha/beta subunit
MDSAFTSAASEAPTSGEHRMGTTIVGVCYDGGVVLGADSRTSTGTAQPACAVGDVLLLLWTFGVAGIGTQPDRWD